MSKGTDLTKKQWMQILRNEEQDIHNQLFIYLANADKNPVTKPTDWVLGIPDIVTPRAIYEVKAALTTNDILHAVGQVMVYRHVDGNRRRPVIVGQSCDGTDEARPILHEMGIELVTWKHTRFSGPLADIEDISPEQHAKGIAGLDQYILLHAKLLMDEHRSKDTARLLAAAEG